jgi:hypothetical protein
VNLRADGAQGCVPIWYAWPSGRSFLTKKEKLFNKQIVRPRLSISKLANMNGLFEGAGQPYTLVK